ncbi:DNA polymerase III subunit gamma/tau [Moraxella haemolytica]|uniref:DNA polymerase III subunit gamma/tau n=1 Tax=Moraxella haemolytica TaxID=2904119 RepID=UPI0025432D5F|nr:DNA polymerase III subunit gamma/tau [Moraxella sp. ZY171148]WII96123.1 DNA polymerase III subunit gamma/tau [Moraxella sp. ZY171148]
MSEQYQVLARKYRPKNFAQMIGQTHITHALTNAIDTGRLHHAYLFTGTRGVGKTTIARILAKCLNCETGITSQPCGVCDTCVSVDNGRFIDLIEIDAASRTKVEDTRDLLENVPYAPTQGRYKVYLIDEVHMLSTHSFNALLKTLEEPPEHVKFILATTDPQKLPITIVSRCLQFVLRPMSQALLHEHLSGILNTERIDFDENAVWQLASSAKGSVRDALSLTDQAIAFGGGRLNADTVAQMLGLVDGLDVISLIDDIYTDRRQQVAQHITRLREQMVDAVAVLDAIIDGLHELALIQFLPLQMDKNQEQRQAFLNLSQKISADTLQLYYEIAIKTRESVRLASTPMQALEMGILRLLAFRPLHTYQTFSNQTTTNEINVADTTADVAEQADNHTDGNTNDNINNHAIDSHATEELSDGVDVTHTQKVSIEPQMSHYPSNDNDGMACQELDLQPKEIQGVQSLTDDILTNDDSILDTDLQSTADTKHAHQDSLPSDVLANHTNEPIELTNKASLIQKLHAPKAELTGEWDAQKWDYWLFLARQEGIFDNDELALLHHSRMMGSIDNVSTLYVQSNNAQVDTSFASAKEKIARHFPDIKLSDELPSLTDNDKHSTPYVLQQERAADVLIDAQNQIIQSPVVQQLWQLGFIQNDKNPIIVSTKLTLDHSTK